MDKYRQITDAVSEQGVPLPTQDRGKKPRDYAFDNDSGFDNDNKCENILMEILMLIVIFLLKIRML